MNDKTSEQLRSSQRNRPSTEPGGVECHSCGAVFIGDESHTQCGVCANTRADSGEAVALLTMAYRAGFINACNWSAPCSQDVDSSAFAKDLSTFIEKHTPLFTHPRATAVDARYVTVKHPRFFNEEENNAWHRALPDIMAAFDAIAAIASREGEVS